jgi:hypothetical protein
LLRKIGNRFFAVSGGIESHEKPVREIGQEANTSEVAAPTDGAAEKTDEAQHIISKNWQHPLHH